MKRLFIALAVLIFMSGYSADANAQDTVVVPNSLTNVEGDRNNVFPLNCDQVVSTQRYQQIYAAEQIGNAGTITAMKFRVKENTPAFGDFVIPGVQIDMSITPREPENASTTFAINLGPVVQTVFEGGLTLGAPECTNGPCPFDIMVPLDTPFVYDPSQGNLIVDWRMNPCPNLGVNTSFDATSTPVTGTQRVFTSVGQNVDSPTGRFGSTIGLVTQFVITRNQETIPTLSEWGLIAMASILGIVGFMVIRRRKVRA